MFKKTTSDIFLQLWKSLEKGYNVMIDGRNSFDQPVCDEIWKIRTGQVDDCRSDCLLDYPYLKKYYKLIATDLSKQQRLEADPKETQQINFTGNLERDGNKCFSLVKKRKKPF